MLKQHIQMWASIALVLGGAVLAYSQQYPYKPVRIVLAGVGGTSDFTVRLIAPSFAAATGQPLVVDNRTDLIAIVTVAKAAPDGYTLVVSANTLWIVPFLQPVSYNPERDLAPIMPLVRAPNILVVNPSLPVNSVGDLIELAKARPNELNYASSGSGSSSHLAAELFKVMAGVRIVRIPYKSGGLALNDLFGGRVQLMFGPVALMTPHIKSGKLKALAVAASKPSPLLPGLPTVAASGVPGYESEAITVLLAPAKTPTAIIQQVNREISAVLKLASIRDKFADTGLEASGGTPHDLAVIMKTDGQRLGKLIRDAGIKAD